MQPSYSLKKQKSSRQTLKVVHKYSYNEKLPTCVFFHSNQIQIKILNFPFRTQSNNKDPAAQILALACSESLSSFFNVEL